MFEILEMELMGKRININKFFKDLLIKNNHYLFFKRNFDFLLALGGIIFFLPLSLLISLLIYLEKEGSIFYIQKRVGKDGKIFNLYKFRSMIHQAEKNLGPVLAHKQDERITKIGRFLRSTALDELPQLINILKGEMSFVGPRPERPEIAQEIVIESLDFELRNIVIPGLTGMAQAYGNYDTTPISKLRYDLFYIKKMNFWLDLRIIFRSILITLKANWNKRTKRKRSWYKRIIAKIKFYKQIRTEN